MEMRKFICWNLLLLHPGEWSAPLLSAWHRTAEAVSWPVYWRGKWMSSMNHWKVKLGPRSCEKGKVIKFVVLIIPRVYIIYIYIHDVYDISYHTHHWWIRQYLSGDFDRSCQPFMNPALQRYKVCPKNSKIKIVGVYWHGWCMFMFPIHMASLT